MKDLARAAAHGIDQDVDLAEAFQGFADHPIAVTLVRGVSRDREAIGSGGANPFDGCLARFASPACDRHSSPGSSQRLGQSGPDATASARHERDAPVQVEDVKWPHRAPPRRGAIVQIEAAGPSTAGAV
jgi:hypothetical protein